MEDSDLGAVSGGSGMRWRPDILVMDDDMKDKFEKKFCDVMGLGTDTYKAKSKDKADSTK